MAAQWHAQAGHHLDCLSAGLPPAGATNVGVVFTREPSSLKICGCCTLDTDTTLYAIDDRAYNPFEVPATARRGMLWGFTDCLSKKGPALITEDKSLIGCDPVSGRAQKSTCAGNSSALPTLTSRLPSWKTSPSG